MVEIHDIEWLKFMNLYITFSYMIIYCNIINKNLKILHITKYINDFESKLLISLHP